MRQPLTTSSCMEWSSRHSSRKADHRTEKGWPRTRDSPSATSPVRRYCVVAEVREDSVTKAGAMQASMMTYWNHLSWEELERRQAARARRGEGRESSQRYSRGEGAGVGGRGRETVLPRRERSEGRSLARCTEPTRK